MVAEGCHGSFLVFAERGPEWITYLFYMDTLLLREKRCATRFESTSPSSDVFQGS